MDEWVVGQEKGVSCWLFLLIRHADTKGAGTGG